MLTKRIEDYRELPRKVSGERGIQKMAANDLMNLSWRTPFSTPIRKDDGACRDLFQNSEKLLASAVSICRLKGSVECQTGGLITVCEELQSLIRLAFSEISQLQKDLKSQRSQFEDEISCLKERVKYLESGEGEESITNAESSELVTKTTDGGDNESGVDLAQKKEEDSNSALTGQDSVDCDPCIDGVDIKDDCKRPLAVEAQGQSPSQTNKRSNSRKSLKKLSSKKAVKSPDSVIITDDGACSRESQDNTSNASTVAKSGKKSPVVPRKGKTDCKSNTENDSEDKNSSHVQEDDQESSVALKKSLGDSDNGEMLEISVKKKTNRQKRNEKKRDLAEDTSGEECMEECKPSPEESGCKKKGKKTPVEVNAFEDPTMGKEKTRKKRKGKDVAEEEEGGDFPQETSTADDQELEVKDKRKKEKRSVFVKDDSSGGNFQQEATVDVSGKIGKEKMKEKKKRDSTGKSELGSQKTSSRGKKSEIKDDLCDQNNREDLTQDNESVDGLVVPKSGSENGEPKPPATCNEAGKASKKDSVVTGEEEPLGDLSFLINVNSQISAFVSDTTLEEHELDPMTARERNDVYKLTQLYKVRARIGSKAENSLTTVRLSKQPNTQMPRPGKVDRLLSELSVTASKEAGKESFKSKGKRKSSVLIEGNEEGAAKDGLEQDGPPKKKMSKLSKVKKP